MSLHHLKAPLCSRRTEARWIDWWTRGRNRKTGKVHNRKKHHSTKSTVQNQGKRRCRVSYMSGLWTGGHSAPTRSWSTETRSSHTGVRNKIGKARLETLERLLLGSRIWIQAKNWKGWPCWRRNSWPKGDSKLYLGQTRDYGIRAKYRAKATIKTSLVNWKSTVSRRRGGHS